MTQIPVHKYAKVGCIRGNDCNCSHALSKKETSEELHARDPPRLRQVQVEQEGSNWKSALSKVQKIAFGGGEFSTPRAKPTADAKRKSTLACKRDGKDGEKGIAQPQRARSAHARIGVLLAAPAGSEDERAKAIKRAQNRLNIGMPDIISTPCHFCLNGKCKHKGDGPCPNVRRFERSVWDAEIKGAVRGAHKGMILAGAFQAPPVPKEKTKRPPRNGKKEEE